MTQSPRDPSPVAVIGAGVVGAAIAHRLAGKGVDVLLLDRVEPGGGATAASLGGVSARKQLPRSFFDLSVAAMEEYRRFAWGLAPAPWYHADGTLVWATNPHRSAALVDETRRLREWGYAVELIPAKRAAAELAPGLAGGDISEASVVAWFPREAWVDPPVMARRLIEATRNAGGRILTGAERQVVAIGTESGRIANVTLRGGQTVPAHAVVNAAGIAGGDIAALVGRRLPVTAPRGLAVRLELPPGDDPLPRPIHTDQVAVRPDGPGRVLIVPLVDPRTLPSTAIPLDDPLVTDIVRQATSAVPALAAARPVATIAAPWPLLADGLPSVGGVPELSGYYEAVTDYGVTLAPLIARALADEILGLGQDPLFTSFSPARFASL
jgi:glycine/D-amino acid oxidase-like deaminating enzyme